MKRRGCPLGLRFGLRVDGFDRVVVGDFLDEFGNPIDQKKRRALHVGCVRADLPPGESVYDERSSPVDNADEICELRAIEVDGYRFVFHFTLTIQ
jgi:hypothetical protein